MPKCAYTKSCTNQTSPRRELSKIGKFYKLCDFHRQENKEYQRAYYRLNK